MNNVSNIGTSNIFVCLLSLPVTYLIVLMLLDLINYFLLIIGILPWSIIISTIVGINLIYKISHLS
nr:MAG TPA: hypothetical protein [Caudoviricetes sp.]